MAIRERVAKLVQTQPDRTTQPRFGAAGAFDSVLPSEPGVGVTVSPSLVNLIRLGDSISALGELYRTQWAVRTCVNFLALNMAHLNLKTWRRISETERDPATDSDLAMLLRNPNTFTSKFDLMRDTVSDLAVYMNAYWWKARRGDARQLIRVPPCMIEPKGGSVISGSTSFEIETSSGEPIVLAPDEVVHIRGYNPIDPRIGSPVLYALRTVLTEEVETSAHRIGFFRHSARRDGIIERPLEAGNWSDVARERFREDWQAAHAGSDNAGKAPILEDGMKWNPDSWSPKEYEFIAGRQFTLDTVATAFHIPLAMLSRTSTPTFASMKEFRKSLYVDVLGPWSAMIESALALQLVPDFNDPDLYVEFNIEEKLQGDFEEQANAARNSVQVPWVSVNDQRAKRGFPPVGDPNDDSNPYNTPARPSNYLYGDAEAAPVAPAAPATLAPAANGQVAADMEQLERILEATDGR